MTDDTRDALTELEDEIDAMLQENHSENDTHYGWMSREREQVLRDGRAFLRVMLAVGGEKA